MPLARHLVEYDNLSIKLVSQLAHNALGNISSSAGKMLDVACLFFDKDISTAIQDFHQLYQEQSQLNDHKDAVNQQADEILAAAQDPNFSSASLAHNELPASAEQLHLANIQKELEALIQQDEHIKQRMVPVMQCMQYEDLISNRIQRLISCWQLMVTLLNDYDTVDIPQALANFNELQSSFDEHQAFYQHVLHANYEDYVDQDQRHFDKLTQQITSINELLDRLVEFSQRSLDDCIGQTQHAFDELLTLLNLVTGESAEVAYLFTDDNDSFNDIKAILKQHSNDGAPQASAIIQQIAATREKHNEEASALIQSFIMALQSQDIIRQNIENIGRFHLIWATFRERVKGSEQHNPALEIEFGQQLMGLMTSHSEREIIEQNIAGVSAGSQDDEAEFF
ncbi:MAG: hypothetical protein RPT11_01945 [Bermanella sp.]